MIGQSMLVTALLLPTMVMSIPSKSDNVQHLNKGKITFANEQLATFAISYCHPQSQDDPTVKEVCTKVTKLAEMAHGAQSLLFCSRKSCLAKYDPLTGLCQCEWGSAEEMKEDNIWPKKNCKETTVCFAPLAAHWNPTTASCTCAVAAFPTDGVIQTLEPDDFDKLRMDLNKAIALEAKKMSYMVQQIKRNDEHIATLRTKIDEGLRKLRSLKEGHNISASKSLRFRLELAKLRSNLKAFSEGTNAGPMLRGPNTGAVPLAPLPSYIPPPNTEITQQLIKESLLLQPQQLAVVGSVIPYFPDGIITFLVQLDGPIPQTLALNATDTLPCENIGAEQRPSLMLVPRTVKNGTSQTVLPTCLIIAANMYNPNYITYWVQREDGSVYTLLSDNKIHAIDQLDTSQPASIVVRVASALNTGKRDIGQSIATAAMKRRQIFSIVCSRPCPFHHMQRIQGTDNYCGCIFKGASETLDLSARGIEEPSQYTATMTAKACAAMTCINNGGNAALFNPFTATCWCTSPTYVDENENAYEDGL